MKSLLLTFTTIWVYFSANAGIIEWTNRINTPNGGTPVEIGEPEAIDSVRASVPVGTYTDTKVVNRISLGIDMYYPVYFGTATDVFVQVKIKRWDVGMAPLSDTLVWLNVKYTPTDTLQMIALNKVEFANAYKMVFSVEEITVNGLNEIVLPANLYVQGDIFIERYRELNPAAFTASHLKVDRDCNGKDDALEISWDPVIGAEEYQLEWAYVNDYATTLSGNLPDGVLLYDFKFNSTRITTSATSHTISLVFDRGWIVYRVRAVGVLPADPSHFIFGPWNVPDKGTVAMVTANKVHITGMEQHEGDVNWQYAATYAEQGKQKEVISYFDGTLRNRQSVTRVNSDNTTIVGETIYDYQGRPAITVLPVPVTDSICSVDPNSGHEIRLYRDFNKADGSTAYSAKDFDISDTAALCDVGAAPMVSVSGASNYYSTDNPNKLLEQGYVPDANGYPFMQVEYTPDNTGRVRRQGGVGEEFQIGSGNETRYLYGQPNQVELDRLFGSEMGHALRYKKNVVIDAHGQASISYLDQQQRVIATALAGDAPSNMAGIESESQPDVTLEVDAFASGGNEIGIDNRSLVFSTELLVAYQSEHTFSYDFEIMPVDMACLEDICVDCVYDLTIELVDECGINLAPASLQERLVGKFSGTAEEGYSFHATCTNPLSGSMDTTFTASLAPGAYSLNKKLTVNQAALDSLIAIYLRSDCAMTLEDFENITLANVDTSGCEVTCDNCFEQLGTLENFIANGYGNSNDYYLRIEQCEQLCKGDATYCEIMSTLLQMDMSPGGQYGEYINPNTGAHDYEAHLLSIYNPGHLLPYNLATWRIPVLITPQGYQSMYVDENGQRSRIYLAEDPLNPGTLLPTQFNPALIQIDTETGQPFIYPENLGTTAEFINEFQQSWGRSLMVYHPEYCYYETCLTFEAAIEENDAFTSSGFDMLLQKTNTIDQAIANGFVTFNGTTYALTNWFAPLGGDNTEDATAWDPFVYYAADFNSDWCLGNYGTQLQNKFTNYQFHDGAWRSMPEMAALLARCGSNFATSYPTSCYNFGHSVSGVWDMDVINHEWSLLRSMYLGQKQKFQQELSDCIALKECNAYNGCIGNEEFNPYLMMGPGPSHFPFMNIAQPCSFGRYGLYTYKVRRFTDETSLPAQDANAVAYEIYLQTGQCPVEFTFQSLLADLAQHGNLDAPDYYLSSNPHLSAVAQAMNNFNIPGTLPQIVHQGSVSGSTLTIDWTIPPSTVYATITMNLSGTAGWNNVSNIVNLDIVGPYSFTAEGVIYDPIGDNTYTENITGTITIELPTTCDFAPDCSSNELAKKLTILLNTLHLDNQVASTSPVDITPYVSGTYGTFSGLTDLYIQNAAAVGSNLSYVFDGTNTAKIYDPSGVAANGLYIQFNATFTSGVLSTISHFGNLISIGNNSFEIEAFFIAGGSTTVQGTLFRETDGDRIGIKAGNCDLPTPAACQTQAHANFESLQALLYDVLIVQDYDGTSQIDLYSSVEITPAIIGSFPFGVTSTTSELSTAGDTLIITAGTCDLVLSTTNPYSFAQIIGIRDFVVAGEPDNYNNFYDFECTGVFVLGSDTLEATINGSSCLSIKDCNPCITPQEFYDGENEEPASAARNMPYHSATPYENLAQYDENLESITEYDSIRNYLYTNYLQRDPSPYCQYQYELYLECLTYYNNSVLVLGPGSGLFLITDSMTFEAFEDNGLCIDGCMDEFCYRLHAVIAEAIVFTSQSAFLQYINFNNYCGITPVSSADPCEEAYEQYLDCIAYYNSQAPSLSIPSVVNVMTYEVFSGSALCLCIGEFCSRLDNVMTGLYVIPPTASRDPLGPYLEITSCTSPPPCTPSPLSGPPAIMPEVEIANNCVEMLLNQAHFEAQILYQNYVDSLSNALIRQYIDHCLGVQETFKYTYHDKLYHYTLYYYDQAGNLIKTIPPAGVERLDFTSSYSTLSQQIAADRTNRTKTVFTNHRLATRYEYNSLNQLVYQSTPDTDPMDIFELTLPNGLHSELITYKIQMVNENVGYLGGEINGVGAMYRTNDGGITWQKVNNLVGADLKKVVMYNNGVNGLAIGEKGTVLASNDGGVTWNLFPTIWQDPGIDVIHNMNDLAFVTTAPDHNTFIIVGENRSVVKLNTSPSGPTITMLTAGITEPSTASVTSVTTNGPSFFITVNDNVTNTATVYRIASSGSTWEAENSFTAGALRDVHLYDATGAYAVGEDGRMYQKTDAASATERWKLIKSDLVNTIHTVRFFNEQSGVALVELQPGQKYLMRTFNGGENWVQISDDLFNHLSISNNRSHVLAVGNDGRIEVIVPGNTLVTVPVASGTTENLSAGWLDNQPDGYGNSKPHIIVATTAGKFRYTINGFAPYPSWTTNDQAALIGSDNVIDIRAERGWASNQTIYGAAVTQNGNLYRIDKQAGVSLVDLFAITGAGTGNKGLSTLGSNIFTVKSSGNQLASVSMSSSLGDYALLGAIPANLSAIATTANTVIGVGQTGTIANITLNGTHTIVSSHSDESQKTNPNKFNRITNGIGTLLCVGEDGILYRRVTFPSIHWQRVNTNTNETLYSVSMTSILGTVVTGSNGLLARGPISGNNYLWQHVQTTTGATVQSQLGTTPLYNHYVNMFTLYAVGGNGTIIYSDDAVGQGVSITTSAAGKNLYSVSPLNVYNVVIAGAGAHLETRMGITASFVNPVQVPPVRDLHFANATTGTYVADHFVIRTTSSAGADWNVVYPNTPQAPTSTYRKVWTKNASQSFIFGDNEQYRSDASGMATPIAISGYTADNVRAIAQGANTDELHLINDEDVIKLNLGTLTAGTPVPLPSGALANAIHVFRNGSYLVVGENGLYRHFSAADATLESNPTELAGQNLNAIAFTDNITGTLAGDNGAYFTTRNPSIDPQGYLIGVDWNQKNVTGSNDPLGATGVDIYTIAFATPTSGVFGGTYTTGGPFTHSYVRKVFDANARYSNRFFYDKLGRLVVSQNARQYNGAERKFSYTLYDALGRVVEAGEKTENGGANLRFADAFGTSVSSFFNPSVIDDSLLAAWIHAPGERKEVTKSYYDHNHITGIPSEFDTDYTTQNKRIVHVTYEEVYDGNDQTYDHATHYKYDIHGNVKTLVQDNKKMAESFPSIASQRFKRMDYAYDLVSGNVHRMSVQNGQADQWHHAFVYDADNRITDVYTSTTTPLVSVTGLAQDMQNELHVNSDWQNDARYFYYDHGPLARVEIGQNNLQGVDYYYNLQGWLKGVNSSVLDDEHDPGKDSDQASINALFAKDVFGFGLQYYTGDYASINSETPAASVNPASHPSGSSNDLYNGNIRYMQTAITHPETREAMPMLNAYRYDQLNRLTESRSYETGLASNVWNPATYNKEYYNAFTYDGIGNILTQERHKRDGTKIEDLTYQYRKNTDGKLIRNRLYHINDAVADGVDATDIDDMGVFEDDPNLIETANNYVRDANGRLIKNIQEEIDTIIWTATDKVKEIRRTGTSTRKNVIFDYDALGNQIAKYIYNNQTDMLEHSTYYILDAQGQQLSMYEHEVDTAEVKYYLKERNIYGSSRLGVTKDTVNMYNPQILPSYGVTGNRNYELTDHRNNVYAVINDHITPLDENTDDEVDGYQVGIVNVADYSPFNVQLDGRTIKNEQYRYSVQGQEGHDEIHGEGNYVNYKYRGYDPRTGRLDWLRDPLAFEYPHNSPYAFSENSTIAFIELEGLEKVGYQAAREGKYGGLTWHDYTGKSDARITQALGWVEEYHQGHISTERVKRWKPTWYVVVVDQRDYWGRSYGTEISFYNNREDWVNDKPFKVVTQRDFSQWFFSNGDGSEWDGHDDPANTGGRLGGQHGWDNGGKQIFFGTIGLVTAPFTIAAGGVYALVGSVGLFNSADDIIGGVTNDEGKSLLQQLTKDTNYEQITNGLKVGATFVTTIGGGAQLWTMGADAPTLVGTANDVRSLVETYLDSEK